MKVEVVKMLLCSCLLVSCQWGDSSIEPTPGVDGSEVKVAEWPQTNHNFRTEAGKMADQLALDLEQEQKDDKKPRKGSELTVSSTRPLVITQPKPVERVDLQNERFPDSIKPKVSEKKPLKKARDLKRRLPQNIKKLMQAIEDNEMVKAERLLKAIKADIAAGRVVKSDQFLVSGLEAFIYHRLGEDEEVMKIVKGNLEYLQEVLSIKIDTIATVDPRRPINHGEYTEVEDPQYGRGKTMHVYLELTNYMQKKIEDNQYSISLQADLTLKDSLGRFVHEMNHKVGSKKVPLEKIYNDTLKKNTSRLKRSLIYQYFQIPIPANINPGRYEMEIKIIDLHDDQKRSDKKSVMFTVK